MLTAPLTKMGSVVSSPLIHMRTALPLLCEPLSYLPLWVLTTVPVE